MTWEHYAVLAAIAVVLIVLVELLARRHRNRILAAYTDEPEPTPAEPEPAVSTLPEVDPYGWSASRFSPFAEWLHCIETAADPDRWAVCMEARRAASERAFAVRILRDADSAPILAELVARRPALAIDPTQPQRELEGANR